MAKPIYFTDIDGTLLYLYGEDGTGGILQRMFGIRVGPPCHYNFEEAFGITKMDVIRVFDELWDCPVPPYRGAINFVRGLKDSGFRVLGVTMRPTDASKIASYRDTAILELDGLYIVKEMREKTPLIDRLSEGKPCFYLDDNIQTAVDVARQLSNVRVQLITRPWNRSLDLCKEYDRVFGFGGALDGARYIHERRGQRNPHDVSEWGNSGDE